MARLIALFQTYGKYTYLPAIAFGLAGGIALGLTQVMSKLYLGLIGVGIFFFLVWLIWLLQKYRGFWGRRSTQSGANVLASTLAVVVILVVINYVAFRYPVSWDLTENQRFTLAPQSQTLVTSLEKPLKVWIFDDAPSEGDRKLLQNYQRFNDEFSFEFVNPDRRPKLVQDFNVQNKGDVFVEYGDKKQLVQNLLSFQQREALSEIQLTNAIEKVKRDEIPQIYMVQGHGELPLNNEQVGLSEAVTALESKGFVVKPLNLVTDGGIPEDASALVIAGPERQFLEPEVEALKAYTDKGGNLLVMVSPETDPGLEDLLEPWGVSFDPRLVIDLSGAGNAFGLDPTIPIFNRYGNHPITEKLQGAIAIFPFVRPVATVEKPGIQGTTLIEASETMYATQVLSEDLQPNLETDLLGPFDIAVALEADLLPAKMVVVGTALFATNAWFNEAVNGDLFLNSVQWLAENVDQPLSIRAKDPTDRRINLGPRRAMVLGWLTWLIVPLIGLALAVWTWWRQR